MLLVHTHKHTHILTHILTQKPKNTLRIRGSVVDAYEQLLRLNSTFAVPVSSCAPALIIKACDHLRCSDDAVDRAHVAFRVLTLMKVRGCMCCVLS